MSLLADFLLCQIKIEFLNPRNIKVDALDSQIEIFGPLGEMDWPMKIERPKDSNRGTPKHTQLLACKRPEKKRKGKSKLLAWKRLENALGN